MLLVCVGLHARFFEMGVERSSQPDDFAVPHAQLLFSMRQVADADIVAPENAVLQGPRSIPLLA